MFYPCVRVTKKYVCMCVFLCVSVCLSVCMYMSLSVSFCVSYVHLCRVCLSVCLPLFLFVCLPAYLPACLSCCQLCADLPGHVYSLPSDTTQLDIVAWCATHKEIIIFELTVPLEENLADAARQKQDHYASLCRQLSSLGWWTKLHTIQVREALWMFRAYNQ